MSISLTGLKTDPVQESSPKWVSCLTQKHLKVHPKLGPLGWYRSQRRCFDAGSPRPAALITETESTLERVLLCFSSSKPSSQQQSWVCTIPRVQLGCWSCSHHLNSLPARGPLRTGSSSCLPPSALFQSVRMSSVQ